MALGFVWVRGTGDHERWTAKGVYATEEAAMFACLSGDDFIVYVELDKPFPTAAVDAIRMYYPFSETWETSILFEMRQLSHSIDHHQPHLYVVKCND